MVCRYILIWLTVLTVFIYQASAEPLDLKYLQITEPELSESLRVYDINGDGILNEEEIDISYHEITTVIDAYDKKQQEEDEKEDKEEEEKEEESKKSRNKRESESTQSDSKQSESKEKKKKPSGISSLTTVICLATVLGAAVIILVLYITNRQLPIQQHLQDDRSVQRDEWLKKISSQRKPENRKETSARAVPSVDETQLSDNHGKDGETEQTHSLLRTSKDTRESGESKSSTPSETEKGLSKTEEIQHQKSQEVDVKTVVPLIADSETSKADEQIKNVTKDGDSENRPESTEPATNRINKITSDDVVPAPTVQFTLITFLEDVLNCQIEMKSTRMQYSLGLLKLTETILPKHTEEVPEKIGAIIKLIVPRQINRVKYVISCFDKCDDNLSCIKSCDLMTSAAIYLKMKCVEVIFETIKAEEEEDSGAEDLWSDYEAADESNEALMCLWRISGWSKDGVIISPQLLSHLLDYSCHGHKCVTFLVALIQAAGKQVQKVKRLDEMVLQESLTLKGLAILLGNINIGPVLAVVLQNEVLNASEDLGSYFERQSIFGPLLSVTSVPNTKKTGNVMSLTGNSVLPFVELQRKSSSISESDLSILEKSLQDGFHQCQDNIYSALKKVVSHKLVREAGMSWLAATIGLNDLRTASLEVTDTQAQTCCSDGFMLNLCGVVLKFYIPIYGDTEKMSKIDLKYSTSPACRLNYHFETCLAAGQIVSEKENQKKIVGLLPEELQNEHSFITECYHLTQRALSISVIPAITHYNHMHRQLSNQLKSVKGTPKEQEIKQTYMLLTMMWNTSLADVELVKNITMFYLTQARLLLQIVSSHDQATTIEDKSNREKEERLLFQHIPEFCVKDMAVWFRFVASHVIHIHKGILWGLPLSDFVDCCVMLLERPDIMPGPIAASKIISALLQFVQTSPHNNRGMLGWSGTSGLSDLSLMVHTSPTVKTKLGPALLHTYISVDVVEGLDVDKDEFDKYSARAQIGQLIRHLWDRPDCKESILQQHLSDQFQNFLGAILDTLLYMLHDALSRMANVKRTELVKDNESEWSALSSKEQHDRTLFLLNEENAGGGFMALANQTLSFILLLTEEEGVSSCFNRNPLAQRSASAICGFLLSLCGVTAKDYKVKNMAKYNFDPKLLLTNIVKIILHICQSEASSGNEGEGFKQALAADSDFEVEAFQKAYDVIYSKGLTCDEFMDKFAHLIVELKDLQNNSASSNNQHKKDSDWLQEVVAMEINQEQLARDYTEIMSSFRFVTTHLEESHSYQSNTQSIDLRSPKVKALMKEMKQLQQHLPVHPHAAIFVCQDEDRMDLMRVMVTGPVDTPYSMGCFLFDIYFPSSYPNNPPLVKLVTTGNGTVRFNPNLYSDGKVCLSLLGTWHAGDASEKWNPSKSSLYQVLVSIQSIILTSDPMFNEPGYDGMRETEDGKKQSGQYNWKIELQTLRHAILGNIRNPPPGFKNVIHRHYYIQKNRVLKQCADWLNECEDEDMAKRLRVVCEDIHHELDNIELSPLDQESIDE